MLAILKQFWAICLFKSGPQDLSYSKSLCLLVIILNGVIGWYHLYVAKNSLHPGLISLVLLFVNLGFVWVLLQLKSRGMRYVQTITALMATSLIINVLAVPLMLAQFHLVQAVFPQGIMFMLSLLYLLLVVGINLWLIFIGAHIFSQALTVNLLIGVLISLSMMGLDILLYSHMIEV